VTPDCTPGGLAVEVARSCYSGYWRFYPNRPDVLVRGRFYFVADDTPFLPFPHSFWDADWHYSKDEFYAPPETGELRPARIAWSDGVLGIPLPPARHIGDEDCFRFGEVYPHPPIARTLPAGIDSRVWTRAGLPVPVFPMGGAQVWFRPEELSIYAAGGNIPRWKDVSVYARDLLQATVAIQPVYAANQVNGLPGIRFTVNRTLVFGQEPTVASAPVVFGPAMSAYVVGRLQGTGGLGGFVLTGPDTVSTTEPAEALGGRAAAVGGNFSGGEHFQAATNLAANSPHIWTVRREPDAVRYYVDGALVLVDEIDVSATASVTGIKAWPLGIPAAQNTVVCEVLMYDWQTPEFEHDATMEYLSDKYGIPLNV